MRRNYAKMREIMALAIKRELLRQEGHWPAVKAKIREMLGPDHPRLDELYQLADVAAAAVLDCEGIHVSARRSHAASS